MDDPGASGERITWLGAGIDPVRNRDAVPDTDVGSSDAAVRTLVVAPREDLVIAREVRRVLSA